jgi:hypothetical protein
MPSQKNELKQALDRKAPERFSDGVKSTDKKYSDARATFHWENVPDASN